VRTGRELPQEKLTILKGAIPVFRPSSEATAQSLILRIKMQAYIVLLIICGAV